MDRCEDRCRSRAVSLAKTVESNAPVRRFKPYPVYRHAGVEWLDKIPAHWAVTRLKRVSSIRYGLGEPPKQLPDGLPFLRATNVTKGRIVAHEMQFVDPQDVPWSRDPVLRSGDIIVVRSGAYTGDSAIIPPQYDGAIAGYDMVVRPREASAGRFLSWALLSRYILEAQIELASLRAAQPHLNAEELGTLLVLLPSPTERRAIAAFLDRETARIDALVTKKEKLIDLLQEQRTALITCAVTKGLDPNAPMKDPGVEWLGEVPAHWEVKRIRDVAEALQTGPFGSQLHAEEYVVGGYPIINPANLRDGKLVEDPNCTADEATGERLTHHRLRAGDILFARRGELGRCGLVERDQEGWLCGTGCLRLRARSEVAYPPYFIRLLSTSGVAEWLQLQSVGATMQNLNTFIIGRIPLAVPPIPEQKAVAAFVDDRTREVDALIATIRDAIARLRELRTALISAAVTGKIDVRGELA
jgi:type I restriction enzyme S subunit